eukprot:604148-Ditylum_brightwellii.AAC.1
MCMSVGGAGMGGAGSGTGTQHTKMGAYHLVLSIVNELSSVDQVETIVIHASVAVGFRPKILHQTCSSTKGGPCHVSLICAQQEYHQQQIAFLNKGKTQKEK